MVLKQWQHVLYYVLPFENDVKMYGTQTMSVEFTDNTAFENDVKMYGTQTSHLLT